MWKPRKNLHKDSSVLIQEVLAILPLIHFSNILLTKNFSEAFNLILFRVDCEVQAEKPLLTRISLRFQDLASRTGRPPPPTLMDILPMLETTLSRLISKMPKNQFLLHLLLRKRFLLNQRYLRDPLIVRKGSFG